MEARIRKCRLLDADPDLPFIRAAEGSPMRVRNASEAKLFVITIPLVSSYMANKQGCVGHDVSARAALRKLVASETWLRTGGRGHFWVLHSWRMIKHFGMRPLPDDPLRGPWANRTDLLAPLTLGHMEHGPRLAWRCTVVVPYLPIRSAASASPSFEEWRRRGTTLHYRNRNGTYWQPHSTWLRQKPKEIFRGVAGALVGEQIDAHSYTAELRNSRFCLVPRGDTPTSTKLFDAVRALCVPVIVSDHFEKVGQPFKDLLAWRDFTVTISESRFRAGPIASTRLLWNFTEAQLSRLLRALVAARGALDWYVPGSRTADYAIVSAHRHCSPGR